MSKKNTQVTPLPDDESLPRISLILPYELKMKNETTFNQLLTMRADESEKELLREFPEEKVSPVIEKLRNLIKEIHCPANGKSIGIFVSPVTEKVYYFSPTQLDNYTGQR